MEIHSLPQREDNDRRKENLKKKNQDEYEGRKTRKGSRLKNEGG